LNLSKIRQNRPRYLGHGDEGLEEELKIFINESYESLNSLDKELVSLGKNPENTEILSTIHANYQTFLESSKFLRFPKLESLTHIGERLTNHVIQSDFDINSEMITTMMKLNTAIREIVFTIDETGKEPSHINASIISDVEEVIVKSETNVNDISDSSDFLLAGIPTAGALGSEADMMDRLMGIVVEMIHSKETLNRFYFKFKDLGYYQAITRLSLLISDFYNQIKQSRNQSVGSLVMNLDKIMKDDARARGKSTALRIIGKDKELDSRMMEGLRVCLIQMVKNAVEHGIELPDFRLAEEKPADGAITIECSYKGELFHAVVTDDGAGIDPELIRKRLVDKGLMLSDEVTQIDDSDILQFLFKEGYCGLNESGSFVGGRPTGLDIVKAKVESMGGGVYLQSSLRGKGTEIHLTLPMINAIVPVISVVFGRERYAIAKVHLFEVLQIDSESLLKKVEIMYGHSVFKHKNRKIPLLYMKQILKYEDSPDEVREENPIVNMVILESGGIHFGLVADLIQDMEEAVVRPLNMQISSIYLFSGVTILQDEKPALILDIGEIRRRHLTNRDLILAISEEDA
jgi:two-component system, chemotaxis family, sensor kinase CheA